MLLMSDPFRQLDRLAQQVVFGTAAHPAAMPLDAWREDTEFVIAVDLPGVDVDSIDVDIAATHPKEHWSSARSPSMHSPHCPADAALPHAG